MPNLIIWCLFYQILITVAISSSSHSASSTDRIDLYTIEGKIILSSGTGGLGNVRILVDEGLYVGIPRADGTFVISGVPSGSYIVSVTSPFHIFEPARVDINTKGKIRARSVDFLQPGKIVPMKYPLKFEAQGEPSYFQKREAYRLTDIIFNPMFLSVIVPMVLFIFLPKLLPQGQEMQEVFQQTNDVFRPNLELPDFSDWLAKLFGGPRRQRATNQQVAVHATTAPTGTKKKTKPERVRNQKH